MSADKSELSPPRGRALPEGLTTLLVFGGGAVALYGAFTGLHAGLERAEPFLTVLFTTPFWSWTLAFLFEAVFRSALAITEEIANKMTILGGIACAVGYFLEPPHRTESKAQSAVGARAETLK